MDKCEKCGFLECRCPDHVAQKRALCLLCGTELLGGRPLIVADLRKLVEKWRSGPPYPRDPDKLAIWQGECNCADELDKLLEDV